MSVSGVLSEYRVEIQDDQLLIKSLKGKVKLQFHLNAISPFSGGQTTMPVNPTSPEVDDSNHTTYEESKTRVANRPDSKIVYQIKIKVNKDRRKVRKFFLNS